MELKKSAQEVLTQAQMLRLEAGMDKLCIEHVLYGLLLMASYKDDPMNNPELLTEAMELRRDLEKKMRSIASAKHQLYNDALHNNTLFRDASEAIGRASELAVGETISAMDLAHAIWEDPTPTMRALSGLGINECISEDEKYQEVAKPQPPITTNKSQENDKVDGSEDPTPSQMIAVLKMLANMQDNQQEQLRQNSAVKQKNPKVKRKTKMGLFTYRGGAVAAAIQYFLFGIIIPFAVLVALEYFTGIVIAPPSPLVHFVVDTFIVLWAYYILRGVAILIGVANNAFSHFLNLMLDLALISGLTGAVVIAWQMQTVPVWLRVIASLAAILIVSFGAALYDELRSEGDLTKTKIMFHNAEGTPAKIFFQELTKTLILPLLIFSIIWIFNVTVPIWLNRTLWIYGYFLAWSIIGTMWSCIDLSYENSRRIHKGKGVVTFLITAHYLLGITALVIFLYWLFAKFPMKLWVIIVLSVYTLFSLIVAAVAAKNA